MTQQNQPAEQGTFQIITDDFQQTLVLPETNHTINAAFAHKPGEAATFCLDCFRVGDVNFQEPIIPILMLEQTQQLRTFLNKLHDAGLL